jgi:DNA gyrase subunit A
MRAGDIRTIGRATQGVRLIEMEEGDAVVSVAKLVERDDAETAETAEIAETEETEGTE